VLLGHDLAAHQTDDRVALGAQHPGHQRALLVARDPLEQRALVAWVLRCR
jgi:hypothetical protein